MTSDSRRRVVAALGGNALLQRGEEPSAEAQRENLRLAGEAVAPIAKEHSLVLTHGNGPQVGLLAAQSAHHDNGLSMPLDVLSAESVGMIGYLIQQELSNRLPDQPIATLLTLVEVSPDDPAFGNPTKPIGPVLSEEEADRWRELHGWTMAPDGGGLRRVVPSPEPKRILEVDTIRLLAGFGVTVICGGGGGMPVCVGEDGWAAGVEAVVDKDLTTALLATELDADHLIFLTDVAAVQEGWGTPQARDIDEATPDELRALDLKAGSMGPKVEAACRFVEATGRSAGIGRLRDAREVLEGQAGTRIVPG